MLQTKLELLLEAALTELGIEKMINYKVDVPPRPELGDFATNLAIAYAKKLARDPMALAARLTEKLKSSDLFSRLEIARPGFINFFIKDEIIQSSILEIIKQNERWGQVPSSQGERILLEFVSANPTGPLHVGHGRWAVIGDVIRRLLKAAGHEVTTEFYVNNVGNQINKLVESVKAGREGKPVPEGGYGGAYVKEIQGETQNEIIDFTLQQQKLVLSLLGVGFDNFFFESSLHDSKKVKAAVQKLHDAGRTFEEGGAIWFKSQELGDDKNRVLIREDGAPTYFAADIAYHLDKFSRGFDRLINIWGTDHHGYVSRLKAALKVLALPVENFEIIIGQLVTLYRGSEPIRMSKRTGEMVTLQEVIDEIGADATRFFFAAIDVNSHLDFDLELAKKQSADNPVYYLQYAHARICSILKKSEIQNQKSEQGDLSGLKEPAERELMMKLLAWPDVIKSAARLRHPHRLTEYGKELAVVFHHFYEKCRVIGNPGREILVNASRITLHNVLKLLGISAPESM